MTSFVDDSGVQLEYSGADLGITKQIAFFYSFQIKGDFTVNFAIPNNIANRKALGYYGARQIAGPALSKHAYKVVKDGNILLRGYIVIVSSDETNINCFFISGNSNWFQSFSFSLKEISFPDSLTVLFTDIDSRKASTSGIVFPLVDWAYNTQKRSHAIVQTMSDHASPYVEDAFPCLYLHTLVEAMAEQADVKITGSLTTDPLYQAIVMTPSGPQMKWPKWIIDRDYVKLQRSATIAMTLTKQVLPMDTILEIGDYGIYSKTSYQWTATKKALIRVDFNLKTSVNQSYTMFIKRNGTYEPDVTPFNVTAANVIGFLFVNCNQGDVVELHIQAGTGGYNLLSTSTAEWKIEERANGGFRNYFAETANNLTTAGDLPRSSTVSPNCIVPDMQAIDLIKFLVNYFGAVCTYTEHSKTLSIDIIAKTKKETAKDWSKYYVTHQEKWDTGVATDNNVHFTEVEEAPVSTPISFGGGSITSPSTVIDVRDLYTVPFGPSVDYANSTQLGQFLPFIQFYKLTVGATNGTITSLASGGTGILSITGGTASMVQGKVYYISSATGYYTGFAKAKSSTTFYGIDFSATDTGTVYEVTVEEVDSVNRLLINQPGKAASDAGGPSSFSQWAYTTAFPSVNTETASATAAIAWFDKPLVMQNIDIIKDSLAIDKIDNRTYNHSISEKFFAPIKLIFKNPLIWAQMVLPTDVFQSHNFSNYIYLKTETLTGYFLVQKIENYKDSRSQVKVELLYAD